MIRSLAHWIGGGLLAIGGTLIAYLPASSPNTAIWSMMGGRFLALAGLAWIAIGISLRVKRDSEKL